MVRLSRYDVTEFFIHDACVPMSVSVPSFVKSRWLRFGLMGLFVIFLLIALLTYALVDSRKVADVAVAAVQKATGRSVSLNGPISLKLLPRLSVVAENVTLGNASWATDPVMAKADRVAFSLEWAPLLRRQIAINEVILSGVTLNLQAAPAGQKVSGNWDLSSPDETSAKGSVSTEALNLRTIQLSNVVVQLRDDRGSLTQSVIVDQMTGSLSETQVDFSGRVRWQQQLIGLKGHLAYKSDAPLDLALDVQSDKIDLKAAEAGGAARTEPERGGARWVFGTDALGFAALPLLNGQVTAAIKTLILPNGMVLPNLALQTTLNTDSGGVLTIDRFTTGFGQGAIHVDGQLIGYSTPRPRMNLRGYAEGFTLDKVLAQTHAGMKPGDFQGGPGQFAFNLASSGSSLRELVSAVSGEVQLSVGAARFSNALMNAGGDFIVSLLNAVNPLSKNLAYTQLNCAVAYLPMKNGLVTIAQSVGIETDRLNVVLDGQVSLRDETLNIRIYPREKSGLTTGVNAAGLVQIDGTFRNPKLGMNKTGVVKQAATVGLAVFTAGISLAAQNVAAIATRSNPCQNVLRAWSSVDGGLSNAHRP